MLCYVCSYVTLCYVCSYVIIIFDLLATLLTHLVQVPKFVLTRILPVDVLQSYDSFLQCAVFELNLHTKQIFFCDIKK